LKLKLTVNLILNTGIVQAKVITRGAKDITAKDRSLWSG